MLHGRILRPDGYGATLVSVDDSARAARCRACRSCATATSSASSHPPNARAIRAAAAIQASWRPCRRSAVLRDACSTTSRSIRNARAVAANAPFDCRRRQPRHGRRRATFDASYRIPYIAHVPLEPRAAVAEWRDGKLTVWTGTQRPFGVRSELAEAFRIPEDRVRVIVPDMGSALRRQAHGRSGDRGRAARQGRGQAGQARLDARGGVHVGLLPSGRRDRREGRAWTRTGASSSWEFDNWNSGPPGIRTPYVVPNQQITFHAGRSRRCARARTARWPRRRITTRARCTWTTIARALGVDPVAVPAAASRRPAHHARC